MLCHCQAKTAIHKKVRTTLSILTSDLSVPVARLHKSRLFVPVAVSVVFFLQTNHSRVKPRPSLLGDFSLAVLLTVRLSYSHMSK